ncbi:MAG: hypothetical protein K6B70_03190, partial [Clostridia bacterium]|nr:hypothetical protein [Clostridia bacterium]
EWKKIVLERFNRIEITQENNANNETIDAGKTIKVSCSVKLPNINPDNVQVEVYYGLMNKSGYLDEARIIPMILKQENKEEKTYLYEADVDLTTGGDYGYTFRVMPKHEMLLDAENLDLVKWID